MKLNKNKLRDYIEESLIKAIFLGDLDKGLHVYNYNPFFHHLVSNIAADILKNVDSCLEEET